MRERERAHLLSKAEEDGHLSRDFPDTAKETKNKHKLRSKPTAPSLDVCCPLTAAYYTRNAGKQSLCVEQGPRGKWAAHPPEPHSCAVLGTAPGTRL